MPFSVNVNEVARPSEGFLRTDVGWVEATGYTQVGNVWREVTSPLYPNDKLAGGGPSGPIDGNNPPLLHSLGFNTVDSFPTADLNGFEEWEFNPLQENGRSYLFIEIGGAPLVVGQTYRLSVQAIGSGSYGAGLTITNIVGLTVLDSFRNVGTDWRTLYYDFSVDNASFAGQVRYGCGTTANNTVNMRVTHPKLQRIVT